MIGGTQMAPVASVSAPTVNNNMMMVNQAQPVVVVQQQQQGNACCSIPPDSTCSVKGTHCVSIAIVIIHAIAMIFALINWVQWIAALFGIITGSVLLCNFNQCCYTTAAVLYSIGVVLDVAAAIFWLILTLAGFFLAIPSILGAIVFLIGAIFACVATCNWNENGASDVTVAQSGPVQVAHPSAIPATSTTAVQPNYTLPVASKGPPPAYSIGV